LVTSSENPEMAVVSLVTGRETSYKLFIEIQDEITKAYFKLRANYANTKFKMSYNDLTTEQIRDAKEAYPFKLSEAIIK